ncbi:MAG: cation:proton antiporter [Burkholderiales bacterium]|jgi:CPA2 family monovalent cation:H+ antiporter-2|nr:cation:proton antiporter [Burkholderiales bacterium]
MHAAGFIQDLALVMLVAGVMTLLFHRFKQPVVLGYILAGVILGPNTPPFGLIHDTGTINILADLGIVFLLFALGLEFSLKKLAGVGLTALLASLAEIAVMMWIGFQVATFFEWGTMNAIFLGAMLSVSSTTIIIKVLNDLGLKRESFAELIFGILIIEDILAIGMIALLSSIAMTGGEIATYAVVKTLGKLSLFMVVSLVLGILIVPRLLAYVDKFRSDEILLTTVLALCFGFCLIVIKLDYSVALGAFVIGAIIAESRQIFKIERIIAPIRDMFSAVFFVAIGLLFDPSVLIRYAGPILLITIVVVLGKFIACGGATFIAGHSAKTSVQVGMGLSQIGEFSFIIAALGQTLHVTGEFLYPIAVAVAAVTSLLTPYLIQWTGPFMRITSKFMPGKIVYVSQMYTTWLQHIQPSGDNALRAKIIRRIVIQVLINLTLVTAIFLGSSYFLPNLVVMLERLWVPPILASVLAWCASVILSLPCLLAAYGKLKALSMILAETGVSPMLAGRYTESVRRLISELIPLITIIVFLLFIIGLSSTLLPTLGQLLLMLASFALFGWLLRDRFRKLHASMQVALIETMKEKKEENLLEKENESS